MSRYESQSNINAEKVYQGNNAFSQMVNITLDEALDFFYSSTVYKLMRSGVSDKHCMSDYYLAQDLEEEWKK